MPPQRNNGITFWKMVMGVWTALKLKKAWDEYKPVATDDVEGGVQLPPDTPLPNGDRANAEDEVSLLSTGHARKQKKKPAGCCMCCGIDCTLFWKAFGIVVVLWLLYGVFKAARWALTPSPTGLEGMPAFSTSLGCEHAQFYYNDEPGSFIIQAPIGSNKHDHFFDLRGSAVGTITVAGAPSNVTEVEYELTLRASEKDLINQIFLDKPGPDTDTEQTTKLVIDTPRIRDEELQAGKKCVRFDIKMYLPSNLKKIHIASHAATQIKFLEGSKIDTEVLFVTLFASDTRNMILPQETVRAKKELALEIYQGWIVGDASISALTSITTQRGDGVANVHVHPAPSSDDGESETAVFRTTTGSGRTDIFYATNKAYKRPIESTHISSRNGDVYLTYKDAEFGGKIAMNSKSYSMSGAQKLARGVPSPNDDETKWTHAVGDEDGGDKIVVNSRGWTGLYF